MSLIDIDNYVMVPHDKGIIIMNDGEFEFTTMAETVIRQSREHEMMSEYLGYMESE